MAAAQELTVGEVAEQAGVTHSAVRFYERHGLITAARTPGNQRRFAGSAPRLVRVARVAQRVGLSVREIATLFAALPGDPGRADWERIATTLVVEATARVDALRATLADVGSATTQHTELFAGIAVADLARSVDWFGRLFGDVEFFDPNDTERVWTIAGGGHVYAVVRPEHAGHTLVTLFVGDLDAFVAAASARGVDPLERETHANGVRKAVYRDPDGNEIGVGGGPAGG